jgi:hypothetical protein
VVIGPIIVLLSLELQNSLRPVPIAERSDIFLWMPDGRVSLIAFKSGEGGGEYAFPRRR